MSMQNYRRMNNNLNEKQLIRVRLRFFDLLKSFFIDEPDAEKMSRWRGTFAALTKEKVDPGLDKATQEINQLLTDKSLNDLQEEYYQLFSNPFSSEQVENTVSYYVDGHHYGPALAKLRSFLATAGLEKNATITDSEDSLVIMLDVLSTLIKEEKNNPETARSYQQTLLNDYLVPFTDRFVTALKQNETAYFYTACGSFLRGYLELEKGLTGAADNSN